MSGPRRRPLAWRLAACALATSVAAGAAGAQAPAGAPATWLLVVAGAGGEPRWTQEFQAAAQAIATAARTRFALPDSCVTALAETAPAPAGRATRENVQAELTRLAARARPGDEVWVVLVGHGSGEGEQSRFNLVGPDMTAADFRRALAPLARQRVAVVNTASASGDFARVLAAPNRAVVTATKSALERNATTFARHFAAALAAPGADVDKDGAVSLLEAYGFARREVRRAYEQDGRLLTEHAQLEDDGDGRPVEEPARGGARDGRLAASLALRPQGARLAAAASADPAVGRLVTERARLDTELAALRARKATMEAAEYERELERLLVALARADRALRAAGASAGAAGGASRAGQDP